MQYLKSPKSLLVVEDENLWTARPNMRSTVFVKTPHPVPDFSLTSLSHDEQDGRDHGNAHPLITCAGGSQTTLTNMATHQRAHPDCVSLCLSVSLSLFF